MSFFVNVFAYLFNYEVEVYHAYQIKGTKTVIMRQTPANTAGLEYHYHGKKYVLKQKVIHK